MEGGNDRYKKKNWRFFGTGAVIEPRPKILLDFQTFRLKILPKFQKEISPKFWERNFTEISRRNLTKILERTFERYFGRGCVSSQPRFARTFRADLHASPDKEDDKTNRTGPDSPRSEAQVENVGSRKPPKT